MADEIRVQYGVLLNAVQRALRSEGMPSEVAEVEASIMVEADLMGVPSHGVRMLPMLVKGIRDRRCNPDPTLVLERADGAVCLMDGDRGPGRYVSTMGMKHAVDRAARYGVGLCSARRVTHWGRAHSYAYRAAQAGMIGICTTNAIPNMIGWGSTEPVLGNNPLAIGVPRGGGHDPVVLDMAMSQAAVGKVGTYLREGKQVPQGWGLDAAGQPTNDPAAILSSGLMLPMGEHKGAGLALMMEILTGALAGGMLSQEVVRADGSGLDPDGCKFFMAINVGMLAGREHFEQRVESLLGYVRAGMGPDSEFLYPGERSWQARDRNIVEGVPLHRQIVDQLAAIGVTLG